MVSKYETVLVTGANSFYAAAIMDRLVPLGIKIHGTVRYESAVSPLKDKFGDSIDVFIVKDICAKGAFEEAIQGCDAVFHIASPFRPDFKDARSDFLDPALNGVRNILRAAAEYPLVRRVVMTSSVAAVINPVHKHGFHRPGYTYTENDWNPLTYEAASTMTEFPPVYTASKGISEKAAWKFMEDEQPHFDLVCVNPCHTWGKYTQHVPSSEKLNFTNSDLARLMDGKEKEIPDCIMPWITNIDAVGDAHVAALLKPEAGGNRYIVATAPLDFQQVVDLMRENFADADWVQNLPIGKPGTRQLNGFFKLDNSKSQKELGIKYRRVEQSVIEFCKQYQEDRKSWLSCS